MTGWDRAATARFYEAFDSRHDRYRIANRELAAHAELERARRVLDVGAGLGGTARAALERLPPDASVVCFEPAAAMRQRGAQLLADDRVSWTSELPDERFDRVLCGAAIWHEPLAEAIPRLAERVEPGGALAFTIPSLYLGEPDEPGDGSDPLLLELAARVANGRAPAAPPGERLPSAAGVEELLAAAGLHADRWTFRVRFTQQAFRDWLKIPALTDALLPDLSPTRRELVIDAAYAEADPDSWRWEAWSGWTASRSPTLAGT